MKRVSISALIDEKLRDLNYKRAQKYYAGNETKVVIEALELLHFGAPLSQIVKAEEKEQKLFERVGKKYE